MTAPDTEAPAEKKGDARVVWGGCQTVLAFGVIIVALVLFDWKAAATLSGLSIDQSRDLVVVANFQWLANEMFWCLAFAPLILLFAASLGRSWRASVIVVAVCLALMAVVGFRWWFARFVAVEVRDNTVSLVHLWPRPDITLSAGSVVSTEIKEESTGGGEWSRTVRYLVIETTQGRYRSMGDGDPSGAADRIRRLK